MTWLETQPELELAVFGEETGLSDALRARGWSLRLSAFELLRPVTADWVLPEPNWPDDMTVAGLTGDDTRALFDLIYRDAGWGEVPGHHDRGYEDWLSIFITPDTAPEL